MGEGTVQWLRYNGQASVWALRSLSRMVLHQDLFLRLSDLTQATLNDAPSTTACMWYRREILNLYNCDSVPSHWSVYPSIQVVLFLQEALTVTEGQNQEDSRSRNSECICPQEHEV